jgi:hypothetical protein
MELAKIKKAVLQEFLSDVLNGDTKPPTAPQYSYEPIVPVRSEIEDENIIVEPPVDEKDFVPVNNVELAKSLYVLAKEVPQDKIKSFYNDIKELLVSLNDGEGIFKMTNEQQLREEIRKLIRETWEEEGYSVIDPALDGDLDDIPAFDPADVAAEEEKARRELEMQKRRLRGKQLYKDIAAATGLSVSGAKGEAVRATKRFIFLMNLADLAQGEYDSLVDRAMDSYINYLETSGALSDEEVVDLKDNPDLVRELDGFREHMRKHVTRLAKQKGVSLEWEKDFDEDAQAAFGAKVRKALGV